VQLHGRCAATLAAPAPATAAAATAATTAIPAVPAVHNKQRSTINNNKQQIERQHNITKQNETKQNKT
jgi:hypothetical protein